MEEIIYNCQEKEQLVTTIQNQVEVCKSYGQQLIEVGLLLGSSELWNFHSKIDINLLVNDTNEVLSSLEMVASQVDINQQQFGETDRSIGGEFKCLSSIGR